MVQESFNIKNIYQRKFNNLIKTKKNIGILGQFLNIIGKLPIRVLGGDYVNFRLKDWGNVKF